MITRNTNRERGRRLRRRQRNHIKNVTIMETEVSRSASRRVSCLRTLFETPSYKEIHKGPETKRFPWAALFCKKKFHLKPPTKKQTWYWKDLNETAWLWQFAVLKVYIPLTSRKTVHSFHRAEPHQPPLPTTAAVFRPRGCNLFLTVR
jgi:hypothetical protein